MTPPRIALRLPGPFEVLRDGESVAVPGSSLRGPLALPGLHKGSLFEQLDDAAVRAASKTVRAQIHTTVHREAGDHRSAVAEAVRLFAAMPEPLKQARALQALAAAHTALGDPVAAGRHRAEAAAILARLGVPEAAERSRKPDRATESGG